MIPLLRTFVFICLASSNQRTFAFAENNKRDPSDPYSKIEHVTLKNGLNVFLAPIASRTFTLHVEVAAGWKNDDAYSYGISHLLEHVLCNSNDKDGVGFYSEISNAGGRANGIVERTQTTYMSKVNPDKSEWLLSLFRRMIFNKNFTNKTIENEKTTISIELGDDRVPNVDLSHTNSREAELWKRLFGFSLERGHSWSEEISSTRLITQSDLVSFHEQLYQPRNITLYISGSFDTKAILHLVKSEWETIENDTPFKSSTASEPKYSKKPYQEVSVQPGEIGNATIGIKSHDFTIQERQILLSYMDYLAKRLTTEQRQKNGSIYFAKAEHSTEGNIGFFILNFDGRATDLTDNTLLVQNWIDFEASKGNIEEPQMQQALAEFLRRYTLIDETDSQMILFAKELARNQKFQNETASPYQLARSTNLEIYRKTLKKYFSKESQVSILKVPAFFFPLDLIAIPTILLLISTIGILYLRKLKNRHQGKLFLLKSSPYYVIEVALLAPSFAVSGELLRLLDLNMYRPERSIYSSVIAEYVLSAAAPVFFCIAYFLLLSIVTRRLIVTNSRLTWESLSLRSFELKFNEIASIEIRPSFQIRQIPTSQLLKVRIPFMFFPLHQVLIIRTTNGHIYLCPSPNNNSEEGLKIELNQAKAS